MVALTQFLLAAGSIFGLAQASPLLPRAASYKTYKGDGSVADGWPAVNKWADFETIWQASVPYTQGACKWLAVGANSDAENAALETAIKDVGKESGLDPRFILAVVFQESQGCVRVKTSISPNEGYRNPGLMQCFEGEHTCNDPDAGLKTPCPASEIKGMITDGVGITTKDGLMQTIKHTGVKGVKRYF